MDTTLFLTLAAAILLALTVHEYAHAKIADAAGDPTPRIYGRVTLNPLAHLDPLGTIMILFTLMSGFGIGWGKPVMVDPRKMRDPRWDWFASVLAGPVSNLLLAAVAGIVFRLMGGFAGLAGSFLGTFLLLFVLVNISLFLFNLIPLGPLDGHWLVGLLLPERTRDRWFWWNRRYGTWILLGLVLMGQFARRADMPQLDLVGGYLRPAAEFLERTILGVPSVPAPAPLIPEAAGEQA
jgi:Zn-dependent protease